MPNTTNFNWTTPADTDYVKDGANAIRTLANGIDTSLVDLKGGTTGQILSKNSNTDLDYTWINNDQGDITAVNAGTGISVTGGTGPTPTVAIDSTVATLTGSQTLTNKTIALGSNTVSGTTAQFNTALTDGDFATLAGTETLTNKTISASSNTLTGVINNTLTTTTGDIIYASAANTPARLAIGTSGQVLKVSGGIPSWGAAAAGALTLITKSTFSATATVNINSVFSATYDNYLVLWKLQSSANNHLRLRMRASGSDSTGSVYYDSNYSVSAAGASGNGYTNGGTAFGPLGLVPTSNYFWTAALTFYSPYKSEYTQYSGTGVRHFADGTPGMVALGGSHGVASAYDGFTLYQDTSGNLTGEVIVYGYQIS